jgi:hypothetical protein
MQRLKDVKASGCGLMRSASTENCFANGSVQLRADQLRT